MPGRGEMPTTRAGLSERCCHWVRASECLLSAVAPATRSPSKNCDTLPLGILVEAIGKRLPIVAMPFTNREHAAHPVFPENIAKLRSWGVTVLFGPEVYPLHDPGTGGSYLDLFPWAQAAEAVNVRALEAGIGLPS